MLRGLARRAARKLKSAVAAPEASPLRDPELERYILSFCASPDARGYAEMHLGRFVQTLRLTPPGDAGKSILEMGAYMQITPALRSRLHYGNIRGSYLGPLCTTDRKEAHSSEGESFTCDIDLFNAESDTYPYADATFDTVLCCELLEHLAEDPMHLVFEVNRILKPDGAFVLSTPNICALRAVKAALHRYHPGLFAQYTARQGGNRIEPRHAREYTPDELRDLMEAGGFRVERIETGAYGVAPAEDYTWVLDLLRDQGMPLDLRGDAVHIVARKSGPPRERYPGWLYT